jgi:putative intracellular protease/amidase
MKALGRIKKGVFGLIILLCILVTAQACGVRSKGKVLLILHGGGMSVDYMITNEFRVMKKTLTDAGFTVVVATVDGQPVGQTISVKPDLKLSDVHVTDYKGFIVPCMNAGVIPDESVRIVKEALAQGKPIAAQNGAVRVLGMADGLKGRNFTISAEFAGGTSLWGGTYSGIDVMEDGNIITSGTCPF